MSQRVYTGGDRINPVTSHDVKPNVKNGDFTLQFFNVNNGNIETYSKSDPILKDPSVLLKILAGSVVCFVLSISVITLILIPQLLKSLNQAHSIGSEATLIMAGTIFAIFLLALSFSWLIRSLREYVSARKLDLACIQVTGSIMDKWVEETDDELAYYVRYRYINQLNTRQIVNKRTFLQLERGDEVTVVYQVDRPFVSRLVVR